MGGAIDDDPATVALIADVSAKSAAFAAMWERQAMNVPDRKAKTFRSENLGEVRLDFELLKAFDTRTRSWLCIGCRACQAGL